jgi:hypothetical protein
MHLFVVRRIGMAECGLGHAAGRRTRSAPAQSAFIDKNDANVSFRRFESRHAGRQPSADNQHIAIDNLANAVHRPASGFWSLSVTKTTSIAFSGQTSSHKKQLTQYLFPNGKTLSFLLLKWITLAPQS